MNNHKPRLPYFDHMLEQMRQGDPTARAVFERHVHYGYWDDPTSADGSIADYARAAERMARLITDSSGLRDGMRVLDVGCGFGGMLAHLDEHLRHMQLEGLNIDLRQLAQAQRMVSPHPTNCIGFAQGDAGELPFAAGTFDAVLAVECSFHFPSRARFLQEARRVMRPGARLTVSDFVPTMPMALCWRMAARVIDMALAPMLGRYDLSYTLGTYRKAAGRAGLLLTETQDITAGILPSIPLWRRLMHHLMPEYPGLAALFGLFAWFHRVGLIRYTVLSFERPAMSLEQQPLALAESTAANAVGS